MKILRISLRNLASLAGTHTVDFTREPLRSAGLFSISGPTGSGKSTLLDALCLALYEQTPRLALATGEQIPDGPASATLTPRSPGNLLRRGATEAFAEVAFVAVDGLSYTARWSIRRARNRSDGNLQNTEMVLLAGNIAHPASDPIVVGGRKTDVLPAIAEKVGLTFQQFTRAVLLAQNDFAVFLKSPDQDRASILEALTGTERFARISRLVFERYKKEREAVTALESKLEGAAPLAAEARAAAELEQKSASDGLAAAEAALASVQHHLRWFERDHALSAEVDKTSTSLAAAQADLAAASPREADLRLTEKLLHTVRPLHDEEQAAVRRFADLRTKTTEAAQRQSTALTALNDQRSAHETAGHLAAATTRALTEAQPHLDRARLLDSQIEALAPRLAEATTARTRTDAERLAADQSLQTLRRQIAEHDATLAGLGSKQGTLAPYAPFVEDLTAWRERLDTAEKARATLRKTSTEVDTLAARAKKLRADLESIRATLARHQSALDQAAAGHAAAEKNARAFDPDALAARRLALDAEQAALSTLQAHLTRLADLSTRHHAETSALARLALDHDADTKALDEITRTRLPAAVAALSASQAALKLLEAATDRIVPRLRAALLPQKPCPVCGSLHHPAAHSPHDPEPEALRQLREQVTTHQKTHDGLRTEQTRLHTSLSLSEKNRAARQTVADLLAAELVQIRAKRPESPALAPLLALPEPEQSAAVEDALAKHATVRAQHEKLEGDQRSTAAALALAARKLDEARAAHGTTAKSLATQQSDLAAAEASLAAANAQRASAEKDHADRMAALADLLQQLPDAGAALERDASAFADSFVTQVESLRRLRQQLDEVTRLRAQEIARLPDREKALTTATEAYGAAAKTENDLREEQTRLQKDRQALFTGRPAASVRSDLEKAASDAKAALEVRARDLADAEKAHAAAAEARKTLDVDLASATTALSTARAALDQSLALFFLPSGQPLDRDALATYLGRDAAWLDAERQALAALRDRFQTLTGQRQAHVDALAAHRVQPPTADPEETVRAQHAARVADLAAAKDRHIAALAVLGSDDQRRRESAEFLRQIDARRALAAPWGRLDDLIGSADGAKFRAIVQRHTLDILLGHANAQLDLISARYRLERLPDSLNLIVCDRDMADERRSVHSLSGGESFLVSLALALGLASLTSNRLRIESLFIDEGFGSLDPGTLETVMNALMRLESQGRKVGVISHVSEMADAIPVQIRVVKGRGGASRLEVPGAALASEPVINVRQASETRSAAGGSTPASTDVESLAARLFALIQAADAAGEGPVSTRALRAGLGCDPRSFDAARSHLGARVVTTGRSLGLPPA